MDTGNDGSNGRDYALSGKIMLTTILVLFTVVLIVLCFHLYFRWLLIRRLRLRRREARLRRRESRLASAASLGLDPSVLSSLPIFIHHSSSKGGGDEEGIVECSVCLSEFEEGEKGRRLPICGHGFHIDCIDMWFKSHETCPLCRSTVSAAGGEDLPLSDSVAVSVEDPAAENDRSSASSDSGLCCECANERDTASSSSSALTAISPGGMKSPPVTRILSLRRILSMRSAGFFGNNGGAAEADLERGGDQHV
ncbi:RING-H2 finger protein ATL5 [Acorus gramineus]|uniref:RING-type E3 ubiquitin transferase n=1 Tax=Acorus gramineus TaxID=55184 RepID=A0AAV9BRD8_ACOGR|nr:RING-H2 finger protein ATL5 [Acorus gramineus]